MSFISKSSFQKSGSRCSKENFVQIPIQRSWIPRFCSYGLVMHPNAHQCLEDSNSSSLHPSRHHGNTSESSSEFNKKSNFLHKHINGKIATSIRMTRQHRPDASLIRQDVEKNYNHSDFRGTPSEHGPYYGNYVQQNCNRPDDRATPFRCDPDMELH